MDGTSGVEIDGMEMVEEEVQSFTDNMNRPTADLKLGSSESTPEEGSQGEDSDDSVDPSYYTEDNPYDTATSMTSIQRTMTRLLRCPRASLMWLTPTSIRHQTISSSNYGTMRVPQLTA